MSEWITDRRPTEDDGMIWVCTPSYGPVLTEWNDCGSFPWMPCPAPEPYQPSEPDTPLSASIERTTKWALNAPTTEPLSSDLLNTLEAAKKWDEIEKSDECLVSTWRSCVCSLGTKGCQRKHSESEHDTKYEERTTVNWGDRACPICNGAHSSGDCPHSGKPESPVVSSGDKPKRRSMWLSADGRSCSEKKQFTDDTEFIEALPEDPDPEWMDELIQLCSKSPRVSDYEFRIAIIKHLAKRGQL